MKFDVKVTPFFRWFDLWIGAYVDVPNRTLYVCPFPTLGFRIQLSCPVEEEEAPHVCPGCYAVGGERCAPGCIDDLESEDDDEPFRGSLQ